VGVVLGEVVDHAGAARVDLAAAELLGSDDLTGRGLHQRRAAEEDRALLLDDDGLVGHRRDVGASGGARAHHRGDLRDAAGAHGGLVEEDPAEVLAVGEHLVLHRQERAAGVDEVDARQVVLGRDRLCAQVLLDRHGVVGAALDGGVVRHDDALATVDATDASDDPGAGHRRLPRRAVHPVRRQRAQLQERAARVEQPVDPVAREQLPAVGVLLPRGLAAALPHRREALAQLVDEVAHVGAHPSRLAIVNLRRHRPAGTARPQPAAPTGHSASGQDSSQAFPPLREETCLRPKESSNHSSA
jgi:hypothetical protein